MEKNRKVEKNDGKKDTLYSRYLQLMNKYPLLVNGSQSAIIAGSAVVTSCILNKSDTKDVYESIDWFEVFVMMVVNFFYCTPILYWFVRKLSTLPYGIPGKVVVDQFLFSPVFTAGVISCRLFLKGHSPDEIFSAVIVSVPRAMKSSWLFWIPVRIFSLIFIPTSLTLLTNSLFSFFWNILLSMILNS